MKRLRLLILTFSLVLLVAGCGDDETATSTTPEATPAIETDRDGEAMQKTADDAMDKGGDAITKKAGTEIALDRSQFGDMLFDGDRQAIYVFQRDSRDKAVCYGECADAWPPVYTTGEPVAGEGVAPDLLGTVERRDGRLQATYDGRPLYYYAHEGPGEVKCHNVNLNGGLWWVVGADGQPLS